jgi:hypothetical protein
LEISSAALAGTSPDLGTMSSELERQLSGLKQGDHVCPIYESADERLAVSFLKEGLALEAGRRLDEG